VVYHLSDLDEAAFMLGNIQNHLVPVSGPDHVTVALVVHGPAQKACHACGALPDIGAKVAAAKPVASAYEIGPLAPWDSRWINPL
jgi:uncharacterized protein